MPIWAPPEKPLACITAVSAGLTMSECNMSAAAFATVPIRENVYLQFLQRIKSSSRFPACALPTVCSAKRETGVLVSNSVNEDGKMLALLRLRSGTDIILLMYSVGRTRLMGRLLK